MSRFFTPVLLLSLSGCVGGFGEPMGPGGGGSGDGAAAGFDPSELVCPADPDCHIGGDCSLYECPEHWVCNEDESRCVSPGPDYPDQGEWDCEDRDGATVCTGSSFPDDGGGDAWSCEAAGDLVVCTDDEPSYPDDGGGGAWSCFYEGDLRICDAGGGSTPDGGGWECTTLEDGTAECRRRRPDLPGDDGDWLCYDYDGTTHCDGGTDIPDGGEWECTERDGEYYCVDDTPDYPDGGGGDAWGCRFSGEFRICEGGDLPDGGGDLPRMPCPPGDPSCGRTVCTADERGSITFLDEMDGDDDGEIYVFGDGRRDESCAVVRVPLTGYYAMYDDALAESCNTQQDEISYLTITNSCNADGYPVEHNVGDRFVIGDVDNTPACSSDAECGAGTSCQSRSAGFCCVPTAPAFVGTFLLLAGEDNLVCLHHFCPEYRDGASGGDAFVSGADCRGSIDSVHLQLDGSAFACPDPSLELPVGCGL